MLLHRFLVLEVLLFFHFLQQSHAAWSQEYYFVGQTRGGPSNGTLTHSDHSLGGKKCRVESMSFADFVRKAGRKNEFREEREVHVFRKKYLILMG